MAAVVLLKETHTCVSYVFFDFPEPTRNVERISCVATVDIATV